MLNWTTICKSLPSISTVHFFRSSSLESKLRTQPFSSHFFTPFKNKFQVPFPKERDITRCELRFKPAIPVARHIREFIRWLLNPDERNRPTFNDIQQHAWIKEGRERTERNSTGL